MKKRIWTIQIGRKRSEVIAFAAGELRDYIEKITRTSVAITTASTRSSHADFVLGTPDTNPAIRAATDRLDLARVAGHEDGFVVKALDGRVTLAGNTPRAVLFAVYALLERLGVRWFYPDKGDEVVPKKPGLELPELDICETPTFPYRIYHLMLTEKEDSPEELHALVDWLAKLKMSHLFLNPSYDYTLWDRFAARHATLFDEIRKRGLKLIVGTHGWDNFLTGEYFSKYQQPCYHRKEVLDLLAERVVQFLARHPEIDVLDFWPTEGHRMCECARCRKESYADRLMRGVNHVARRVKKTFPHVRVMHLAYNVHFDNRFLAPPKKIFPDDNVMVEFCAWGREYNEPLDLPKYREWHDLFKQWLAVCHRDGRQTAFVMHEKYGRYGLGFGYHPLPLAVAPKDFAHFERMGANGVEMQTELANWWACGFGRYATAQWMWDRHIRRADMIRDYCARYFAEAAGPMREHFEAVERATPGLAYGGNIHSQWYAASDHRKLSDIPPYLKYLRRAEKILKEAATHLAAAKRAAKKRETIRRIRKAQLAFEHVARQIASGVIQHEAHQAILDGSAFDKRVALAHLRRVDKALAMERENVKLYRQGKDACFWESRENFSPWRDPAPGNNMFLEYADAAVAGCKSIAGRLAHLAGKGGDMVWVPGRRVDTQ